MRLQKILVATDFGAAATAVLAVKPHAEIGNDTWVDPPPTAVGVPG